MTDYHDPCTAQSLVSRHFGPFFFLSRQQFNSPIVLFNSGACEPPGTSWVVMVMMVSALVCGHFPSFVPVHHNEIFSYPPTVLTVLSLHFRKIRKVDCFLYVLLIPVQITKLVLMTSRATFEHSSTISLFFPLF